MGIKAFRTLLSRCPNAVYTVPLKSFSGKTLSVDANNVACAKFKTAIGRYLNNFNDVDQEVDRDEIMSMTVNAMVSYAIAFLELNITPIFVFDGKPPEAKMVTQEKRLMARKKASEEMERMAEEIRAGTGDLYKYKRKIVASMHLRNKENITIRNALESLGIPTVQAIGEAEKLCAALSREGHCAGVVSEDSDTLAFGATILIKNISRGKAICISLSALLQDLDVTFPQFVDICIMAGCDYNSNIPGIGVCGGYNLIKSYGRIENLPSEYRKKVIDLSVLNYIECRKQFGYTPSRGSSVNPIRKTVSPDILGESSANGKLSCTGLSQYQADIASCFSKMVTEKEELTLDVPMIQCQITVTT